MMVANVSKSAAGAMGQYVSLVFCHHEFAPQSRILGLRVIGEVVTEASLQNLRPAALQ